jgi:hypothetical protein
MIKILDCQLVAYNVDGLPQDWYFIIVCPEIEAD